MSSGETPRRVCRGRCYGNRSREDETSASRIGPNHGWLVPMTKSTSDGSQLHQKPVIFRRTILRDCGAHQPDALFQNIMSRLPSIRGVATRCMRSGYRAYSNAERLRSARRDHLQHRPFSACGSSESRHRSLGIDVYLQESLHGIPAGSGRRLR